MISFIRGELEYIGEDMIIVETCGIGYEIRVPYSVIEDLGLVGEEVRIHTYLYVREDALNLYGFLTREDLEVFKLLITVNGIGPKAALGILSTITPDNLRFAILSEDAKTISKAPGIGAKTASKLILELKDKIKLEDAFELSFKKEEKNEAQMTLPYGNDTAKAKRFEATQALVALGYSQTEATKMVRQVSINDTMSVEEVLKQSLKHMAF